MIAPAAMRNIAAAKVIGGSGTRWPGPSKLLRAQPPGQPPGVADGVRLPVVVEVGIHLDPRSPRGDPALPALELPLGIVAAAPLAAIVEADEGPVRGHLVGLERAAGVIADHEGGAVRAQQLVDLRGEPARMAELE